MIRDKSEFKSKAEFAYACAQELVKIRKDPIYFFEEYVKFDVLDETNENRSTLTLYEEQKDLITKFHNDHFVVVLGSRQCAKTTTMQGICVWLLIAFNNYGILHLNRTGAAASDIVRETKSILDSLPKWLNPGFLVENTQHIKLMNGSWMKAEPSGGDPRKKGRGGRPLTIWVDETAFAPKMDELATAVFPAMTKKMLDAQKLGIPYGIVLTSTPNGVVGDGAYFHNIWQQAIDKRSQYKPVEIYWRNLPDRDETWYKLVCETILNNDPRKINQELELKFLGSSSTMLPDEIIASFQKQKPIRIQRVLGGDIWWFEEPDPKKGYIVGIDTATEHGADFSSLSVWDYETLDQVADYRGKLRVKDYIRVIKELDKMLFERTVLIPEKTGVGNQTIEEIEEDEQLERKLFYSVETERGKSKITKGINTTTTSRRLMIDALYAFCKDSAWKIKSERMIGEIISLERKASGKVEAVSGMTDDLAISLAFVAYVNTHLSLAEFKPGAPSVYNDKEFMSMFDTNMKRRNAAIEAMEELNPVAQEELNMTPTITQVHSLFELNAFYEQYGIGQPNEDDE